MTDMEIEAQQGTCKLVGLVRNAKGQPQFDDFNNIPEEFRPSLTAEDWEYIKEQRNGDHA